MIDISMIRCGEKCYSIKSRMEGVGTDNVLCKIITVDIVEPVGATSFKKLKNIFDLNEDQILSRRKYGSIYVALQEKLIQKYHMQNLNFI